MNLIDPTNPTEADRLNAFNYWLALICRDDADDTGAEATVDGSTVTDADGFTCWVLTRHEVKDAGLWYDNLDEVNYGGTSWVIMPL